MSEHSKAESVEGKEQSSEQINEGILKPLIKGFLYGFFGAVMIFSLFMLDLGFRQDLCRSSDGTLCIFMPNPSGVERG